MNNRIFWRNKWGELASTAFPYITNKAADHPMPFIHRLNLTKYFLVVSAFTQKEIKKYAANPARETADLGLDFAALWSVTMSEFLADPQQPRFVGSVQDEMQIFENLISFTEILERFAENMQSDTVNIDIQAIEVGYNNAKQFMPAEQEENTLPSNPMLANLLESNPEARRLLRQMVDDSIANGTFGTWQEINEDGTVSPANLRNN